MLIFELHICKQLDGVRQRKITQLRGMRVCGGKGNMRKNGGGNKTSFPLCQCTQAEFL